MNPLIGLALLAAVPASATSWQYALRLDAETERLRVEVCAPAGVALRLQALDDAALEGLIAPASEGWQLQSSRLQLRHDAACAEYAVDLGELADRRRSGYGYRVGADLLTWPDAWLWWPAEPDAQLRIEAQLPAGWQLSSPWPQPDPAQPRYLLGGWPRDWPGLVAFGRFDQRVIGAEGNALRLAILGELTAAKRDELADWVGHLQGLLDPVGGLALPQAQVLVVPVGRSGGPVPWGQVYRAGYGGVHFFVNPEQPLEAFLADWTGAHEFSHLLHPYLGSRGRWMSEGLASYYQNVLRGHSADLSEREVWEKLLAGFDRGRRDRSAGQPLAEVAQRMRSERAYMRVYWSGAAWWLQRDVELRLQTDGKLGLDRLLARFGAVHLPATRRWTPEEFAAALDQLAGVTLFTDAVAQAQSARQFPDLADLQRRLGLRTDGRGRLTAIDDDAELAGLRRQILGLAVDGLAAADPDIAPP
jgi:hypothetical protein